jgi:hypothetical protein
MHREQRAAPVPVPGARQGAQRLRSGARELGDAQLQQSIRLGADAGEDCGGGQ